MSTCSLSRLSAFTSTPNGGNPAGVWVGEELPSAETMQRIAAENELLDEILAVLDWKNSELDLSLPPVKAFAGAWHLIELLWSRRGWKRGAPAEIKLCPDA
jgi:hypothetical protein